MERTAERDAVLVIDDDSDFREIVRTVLEDQGIVVFEAAECRAGVAILELQRDRLCLVLVDYWMPGMSPRECSTCLQKLAGTDIPIILVTAAANPGARAAELGLARWLSKPFELAQLSRLVRASK